MRETSNHLLRGVQEYLKFRHINSSQRGPSIFGRSEKLNVATVAPYENASLPKSNVLFHNFNLDAGDNFTILKNSVQNGKNIQFS